MPTLALTPLLAFLFGSPWAALAVAAGAASVPIIIHLLNRNRYRVVTWAAMRFLLAAQRKNTRRMRIEQLLLLAVRTLLLLLLVLAMASVMPWAEDAWRHLFPDSVAYAQPGSRRTHKILVIDGSFSMALKVAENTTCFDRARAAAAQVAEEGAGGDGFSVVLMAAPPRRIVPEPSDNGRKVAGEIQGLRLPHGNADLTATLNAVEDLLRKSPGKFEEKEVYFFTDLQRSTWTARQAVDPAVALQKIRAVARTVFVDVGKDGVNNLAVTSLSLLEPPATTGGPTVFRATVHNYGNETRKQVHIDLLVGKVGSAGAEGDFPLTISGGQQIDVQPGQEQPVTFKQPFHAPGEYVVQVRLEHDALELDDTRTVVVSVKDTVPVMLVNGKPDRDEYNQATEWLRIALNPVQAGPVPRNCPGRPTVVSVSDFNDVGLGDLTPYDCVFLCDVKQLTVAEVHRLETHLRSGGGVVFCLGPQVDLEVYNRLLYRNGEGILPARLIGRQQAPEKQYFSFYTDEDNYKEPPLRAFALEKDKGPLLAARFSEYVRAELPPRSRARKILSFMPQTIRSAQSPAPGLLPVNEPALVDCPRYRGRVLLLTTTVNFDWTSWPLSPSYMPMMQELLRFAVSGRLREQAAVAGEPLEEFLPVGDAGLDALVIPPGGAHREVVRVEGHEEGSLLRWLDTDTSGIYRVVVGNQHQEHVYAVNVPTATDTQQASESDLTRTNADELKATYPGWDFQVVSDVHNVTHSGGPALEGAERSLRGIGTVVARGLLLTVLALLLLEVVLAWVFGHYSAVQGSVQTAAGKGGRALVPLVGFLFASCLFLAFVLVHSVWTDDFLGFLPDTFRRGVEQGLGIPPPPPGEGTHWRLEFTPYLWDATADPWLAGALALGAVVLVVLIYLREGRSAGVAYKLLLVGLRVGFLLLLLAVLLPQLRLWFERQGWPDVALIIDDSQSMSATDRYQDPAVREIADRLVEVAKLTAPERLQLAQALLKREQPDWLGTLLTRRKVKVHVYRCAGRAARIADVTDAADPQEKANALKQIGDLHADGDSSQLGTAVRQVLNDFRGSSLSAVVMLTDGVTTEGEDLAKVARYAAHERVPLFFVGLGDAHEVRDLRLHDLQVEDTVYVHDRLIFEARLTGQGYSDLTVPVTLREKGKDKVLATQLVKVDPQGKPVKVQMMYQPTEPGEKIFVLEVPVQPDQAQPVVNNRLESPTIFVREAKLIKVLYVEGYARYEYRFLKTLLERESADDPRNKSIDLKVLLVDADEEYPKEDRSALAEFPSKVELNQYDVILWGDVDPRAPKVAQHLKDVAEFVRGFSDRPGDVATRGGGFLMIAGERYSPWAYKDGPLKDILPIEITSGEPPPDVDRVEGYRPDLTAVGRFHPIFRFHPQEAENTAIWNRLPELYWWAEGYRAKWGAEVLAVHPRIPARADAEAGPREPGPAPALHPLVLQQFVGAGRSMFFGFDETWRWRFREDEPHFNQFWIKTIRYLSRNRQGRITLRLDRQTPYRRGEPIRVLVRFPDDAPAPAGKTEVTVVVERTLPLADGKSETESQTLPLAPVEGGGRASYEAVLTRTLVGEYRFWLSSPLVNGTKPRAECRVVAPPGEMDRLRMNQQDMERAAEETHGRFYTLADADRVLDDIPTGIRLTLNARQPPHLIWNHEAVFALALLLLGTEWFLRKRKHLL